MLHVDFGKILAQIHLKSGGFNCKDCSPTDFVEISLAWTLRIARLGSSFNYN